MKRETLSLCYKSSIDFYTKACKEFKEDTLIAVGLFSSQLFHSPTRALIRAPRLAHTPHAFKLKLELQTTRGELLLPTALSSSGIVFFLGVLI